MKDFQATLTLIDGHGVKCTVIQGWFSEFSDLEATIHTLRCTHPAGMRVIVDIAINPIYPT